MPFNDGTGPNGQGPRSGRGMGNCAGQGRSGRPFGSERRRGGERGQGMGFNRGLGNSWLQTQLDELQAAIQKLADRMDGTTK